MKSAQLSSCHILNSQPKQVVMLLLYYYSHLWLDLSWKPDGSHRYRFLTPIKHDKGSQSPTTNMQTLAPGQRKLGN